MSFIARILSGLVILLSLFVGCILLIHIGVLPEIADMESAVLRSSTKSKPIVVKPKVASWSLSRLPLLPWRPVEQELVAVMVENHELARPFHVGLEDAVLVQEIFVEGFITRFVALFSLNDLPKRIGPVRSLRPYFIQAALPWTNIFVHMGGSPAALERVEKHDDVKNFNGIYLEEDYFYRQDGVPAPHDLFVKKEGMEDMISEVEDLYTKAVELPLYAVGRAPHGSGAALIAVNFHNPLHNVQYEYAGSYKRTNGRVVSQATPSTLVFLETFVEVVGPLGRLEIKTVGAGKALFFRSGKVYEGTWHRSSEKEPYVLLNDEGDSFVFAAGQIWLTVLDNLGRVNWEEE